MLKQFLITIISFTVLIIWHNFYQISCLTLFIAILVSIILAKTNFEYLNTKKKCLANCYFQPNSTIYRLLTRKFFIGLLSVLNAILLTTILVLNIILFNNSQKGSFNSMIIQFMTIFNKILQKFNCFYICF